MTELRRLVRRSSARRAAGLFVAEGPNVVGEAIAEGPEACQVVYVEVDPTPEVVDLATSAAEQGIPVTTVKRGVLEGVLDARTPQPVAALVQLRERDPLTVCAEVADAGGAVTVLVLVGVQDPGNVGAMIRVAEASGCAALITCGGSADLHHPRTVRASAGSALRVPVASGDDPVDLVAVLRKAGWRCVAASADASQGGAPSVPFDRLGRGGDSDVGGSPWSGRTAIVLGGEGAGLPEEVVGACDVSVHIPMAGRVESLNVATAGALLAFEARRAR